MMAGIVPTVVWYAGTLADGCEVANCNDAELRLDNLYAR